MQLPMVNIPALGDEPVYLHNRFEPKKFFQSNAEGLMSDRYNSRTMLVPEDFIVGFQLALEEEVGDAAGEIMYRCGLEWGREDIVAFKKHFDAEFGEKASEKMSLGMFLEQWWWPLQVSGWGSWRYDLSNRDKGLIFVDLYESAVAKSVGNVGEVVCHFYAGMFAGVFSHLAETDLSCIEIQCYSMGEDFCKFLVGSSKRINAAQFWVAEGASAADVMERLR